MKSAKECVTTHLPNGLAPKMDGCQIALENERKEVFVPLAAQRRC